MEYKFVILDVSEVTNEMVNQTLEDSLASARKDKNEEITFVSFTGNTPSTLSGRATLTLAEMRQELKKDSWIIKLN
jgi:hypothetical protein